MMNLRNRLRVCRGALLGGVALCASGAALADPQSPTPPAPAPAPSPAPIGGVLTAPVPPADPTVLGTIVPVGGDLSPLYGRINPFYGDVSSAYGRINPFYGRINPFYGRINPFWGDVGSFWGRINPFTQLPDPTTGLLNNNYDAFWGTNVPYKGGPGATYGSIGTFWTNQFAAWTPILAAWNNAATVADATQVAASLQNNLVAPMAKFWGPLDKAAPPPPAAPTPGSPPSPPVTAAMALIRANLSAVGVTVNADGSIDPGSLLAVDPSQRAMLFLNLYDNLMDYAGTGHVDWWMGAVGWSPALAQTQGSTPKGGVPPTVGMIDFVAAVTTDANGKPIPGQQISKQLVQYGSTQFSDGHGAAVASLIMGAVDGSGVLGVLPANSVNVMVYDPYDATDTTNWTDVGTGVATLTKAIFGGRSVPVGVLNASLGVPGWTLNPGWNDALANAGAHGHDLVIAAGNDGVTQTQNVPWNYAANPTILIVGSVGADGTISNFSNRPGEACLLPTSSTVCNESDKLKYRFVVAPGELILVSDGMGGHMRQSGTSLAAPLVSGAIGLLQNRWPWLSNYPDETASIILKSATPLGTNPGADPVYGAGELNIAASQAPLSYANLVYYAATNGKVVPVPLSLATVVTQIQGGSQTSWDALGLSYTAVEPIGQTFRDFAIPLSSKLIGQTATTAAGGQAYQAYLSASLRAQAGRFAALSSPDAGVGGFVTGFARTTLPAGQIAGYSFRVSVTPADTGNGFLQRDRLFETNALVVSERNAVQFGFGNAAAALDGSTGFAFRSDYDVVRGGANPLLGLASGGAYLGARTMVAPGLTIGFGTTERSEPRNLAAFGLSPSPDGLSVDRYAARAQMASVGYALGNRLALRAAVTHLDEDRALLGVQSLDRNDLTHGAATDGVSMGFDFALTRSITLSGTGTIARTRSAGGQITTDDLTSAAAEIGIVKSRLFGRTDELRLSVASPLHTVGGSLSYSGVGVVDRETGALGIVTQTIGLHRSQPLAGQAMYGMALPRGRGEFSLFGRVDTASELVPVGATYGYTAGAQLHLAF